MASLKNSRLEMVLEQLEQQDQLESIHYLVQKLPELVTAIQSLENQIAFVTNVVQDRESLQRIANEAERKIEQLSITKEHIEAMVAIVQMLPTITRLLQKIEDIVLFIENVVTDDESIAYTWKSINALLPIEKITTILKETNERFQHEKQDSHLSLLRMYRLLKNPLVQQGFKYMETLLEVANQQKK